MIQTSVGHACGKFILIGEHFVVPNEMSDAVAGTQLLSSSAIAFALPQLQTQVKLIPSKVFQYKAKFLSNEAVDLAENRMGRALYAIADSMRFDIRSQPFQVISESNFEVARGFGSSASFAVALTRAFDQFRWQLTGERADLTEISKGTLAVEKIFHGKPSGLDTAVILAECPILFKNHVVQKEINNYAVDFIAIDSGTRDECLHQIAKVSEFKKQQPQVWNKMAQVIEQLTQQAAAGLLNGKAQEVVSAIDEAHKILCELNLSNDNIESILTLARKSGALAGKVSGAGGGGAVIVACKLGQAKYIAENLKAQNIKVLALSEGNYAS